jgi:hypothetical protein
MTKQERGALAVALDGDARFAEQRRGTIREL